MKKRYIALDFPCPSCNAFIHLKVFSHDIKRLITGKIEVIPVETTGYQ